MEVMQEIKDYVRLIDDKFIEGKSNRISRFSIEWGRWSRDMNQKTKEEIKKGHPKAVLLKYVFIYWVNRSQLLELYYKFKAGQKISQKTRIKREGRRIKRLILSGTVPDLTEEQMKRILLKSSIK